MRRAGFKVSEFQAFKTQRADTLKPGSSETLKPFYWIWTRSPAAVEAGAGCCGARQESKIETW